jgi:uncharacterized protein (TIGR02246 family)
MLTRKLKIALGLPAAAVLSILLALGAPAHAAAANGDESAVKKLFDDFRDAFNRHDAKAVAAYCSDDVDYIVVNGEDVKGRSEVEGHMTPLYNGRLKAVKREATVRSVRFVRPDVAIVIGDFQNSGAMTPSGDPAPAAKGIYDWVVSKHAGKWTIDVWHEEVPPAPAAPPATH